jgi:hypothetical protein
MGYVRMEADDSEEVCLKLGLHFSDLFEEIT